MDDLTDGTINGWPVSLWIERDLGGKSFGAHCCPYTNDNDDSAPDDIWDACDKITDACADLTPSKSLRAAAKLGFVPE